MITFIPAYLYGTVFVYTVMALCLMLVVRYSGSNEQRIIHAPEAVPVPAIVLTAVLIIYLGFRPGLRFFGDSYFYAHTFNNVVSDYEGIHTSGEWLFNNIMWWLKSMGMPVTVFFFVVELVYITCMLVVCWRLFPNNTWIALVFCLASYSFYAYGVNGIRNGMATSMAMLGMTLAMHSKREAVAGIIIMLLSMGVHRSVALPIAAFAAAVFFVREPRWAIRFWFASIAISLVLGNTIGDFFSDLGFDDRMSKYFKGQDDAQEMERFSSTGFRFDFLLYSAMPVLMTWYCTIKRHFNDRIFNAIAVTYILSNSFWIMVIRAAYSNRFAYLSWFLYPLVIVYPLLRFDMWPDQDAKTARILAFYAGFTYVMFLLGKY